MPNVVKTYVRYIDAANKKVGKFYDGNSVV
jgi:hypothetical protein